ncbi:hypothetical protein ACHAXA_009281, partial [Cyclostephanos tholiformis]
MTSFDTVHVVLSPADASKLSGRYETAVEVNELLLQGSITPQKVKPSVSDIDDLCDLFVKKVKVSPKKKKPSESTSGSANVSVPRTGDGIDATGLSSIKKSKNEAKAEALAKAKAWKEARSSSKTVNSTQSFLTNEPIFDITGKKDVKAEALAKANALEDARVSSKTASAQSVDPNEADRAQDDFIKALKTMPTAQSRFAASPRRSRRVK